MKGNWTLRKAFHGGRAFEWGLPFPRNSTTTEMSWKGFTKAINRLPAMLAISTGSAHETKDEEFLHLEEQFKLIDLLARKLSDDTRKFKDSLSLMLHHQAELAKLFTSIYAPLDSNSLDENDPSTRPALEFARAMEQAKESLQADLHQLERLVVAPTTDLLSLLDIVKRYIVKRSHKLLDYDRHGESLKGMREKPNRSVSDEKKLSAMEATFDQAARDYNNINNLLKQDLTVFLGMRKDFIDPCLLTFYNYQVRVYDTLYRIYYQVGSTQFDLSTTALAGYQHIQEDLVNMLEGLSVTHGVARPNGMSLLTPSGVTPGGPGKSPTYNPTPTYSETLNSTSNQRQSYDHSSGSSRPLSYEEQPRPNSLESQSKQYVIALFDFEAQADGDLAFKKDDKIEVLERKEDINDWWTGRIGNRVGSFPGNYTGPI